MNTDLLLTQFQQDGFLVLEDFFDAEPMRLLDALILEHFGDDPAFLHTDEFLEKAKTDVIPWFPQNQGQSDFDLLDDDEALQQLTRDLLGDGWQRLHCMVMFSKQGTVGQAWHQDCAPDHPAQFNLNRLVYTNDIDDETGGQTVVVPGSHRRGVLPAGDPWADLEGQVILRPGAGTLVLLHGHTWHRVLPIHGRYRYSTNYRTVPAGTASDITDVCVYRNMRYRFSTESVIEERTT
jgi:hypothetical protein